MDPKIFKEKLSEVCEWTEVAVDAIVPYSVEPRRSNRNITQILPKKAKKYEEEGAPTQIAIIDYPNRYCPFGELTKHKKTPAICRVRHIYEKYKGVPFRIDNCTQCQKLLLPDGNRITWRWQATGSPSTGRVYEMIEQANKIAQQKEPE